jgi:hypothetical protein
MKMPYKKLSVTIGERFNRLIVLAEVEPINRNTAVLVRCDCGNEFVVRYYCLGNNNTKSCGCLRTEMNIKRNIASTGKKKKGYVKKDMDWWNHWENNKKRRLIEMDKEIYFDFLDELRESGVTNMFGATPYLRKAFVELNEKDARDILTEWMKTFGERHPK